MVHRQEADISVDHRWRWDQYLQHRAYSGEGEEETKKADNIHDF